MPPSPLGAARAIKRPWSKVGELAAKDQRFRLNGRHGRRRSRSRVLGTRASRPPRVGWKVCMKCPPPRAALAGTPTAIGPLTQGRQDACGPRPRSARRRRLFAHSVWTAGVSPASPGSQVVREIDGFGASTSTSTSTRTRTSSTPALRSSPPVVREQGVDRGRLARLAWFAGGA